MPVLATCLYHVFLSKIHRTGMTSFLAQLVLALAAAGSSVEIIAHRGESADAPENTLAAFRLAWNRQVTTIELDVHLTMDNELVVSHDKDTKRTTGIQKIIKDSPAAALRVLDVGRWKDASFAGETMPTLSEALATIPPEGRCFIEVKVGPEAIPRLVEVVERSKKSPAQLAVISFQADTIAESKRRLPKLAAYYLASFKQDKKTGQWKPPLDDLIRTAQEIKADGLDLSFEGPLDEAAVRKIKDAGLRLYVWTVDDPEVARRLVNWGVDGITTNKARWLKDALTK